MFQQLCFEGGQTRLIWHLSIFVTRKQSCLLVMLLVHDNDDER